MSGATRTSVTGRGLALAALALLALPAAVVAEPTESWTQWGGPGQDFKAPGTGLADSWGEWGPEQLWVRDLGEGYSTILVEDGRLYTMYRAEDLDEVVIAMNAATGETIWEHVYDDDPAEGHVAQFGTGPRSTPLIVGDTIYTIGIAGMMHALNKADGKVLWSHDLWGEEFGGTFLNHGYSSSPIEYKDTIIVLVGGEGKSIVAFDKQDGSTVWAAQSYKNSYSTGQILEVNGQEQLVVFMAKQLVGVDPNSGEEYWSYPIENQWDQNINLPALVDGQYLFLSTNQAGSRGLKLTPGDGGKTNVEELWSTRKIQFYHATTVNHGDYVYGSSGSRSPAFMSAINVKTGEIPWRKRGFAKANSIYADGKIVVLDEDGKLYLTTATPEDLTVHSEFELLDRVAWSAPTIVGKHMYVRDKNRVMALDLSASRTEAPAATKTAAAKTAEAPAAAESEEVAPKEDSEAVALLRKADAATRAMHTARFKAKMTPGGTATQFASPIEGEGLLHGWTGESPEKFFGTLKIQRRGSDSTMSVTVGTDGENFFLLDHDSKKAYEDIDNAVLGSARRPLSWIFMPELVHDAPFEDEINAEAVELLGKEDVAGVECHKVRVVYGGRRGESIWYFGTEDLLPRRRVRKFQNQQGEGSLDMVLMDLVANPEVSEGTFELQLPKGYEQVDDFAP
ncbi:MAG: PQQ-binding-like beta-propeller repeat protein [Acidobacteriota bacterium]